MSGRTLVNIASRTVYNSVDKDDDLFDVASGAALVLLGTNTWLDDAVQGAGSVRMRGATTIAQGLALSGSTVFVNFSDVAQSSGNLSLGQTTDDSVILRNRHGATWRLADGAGISGAGASRFVNLGTLEAIGASTIDANFFDRAGTIIIDGSLVFASPGFVNRFIGDVVEGAGAFHLNGGVLVGSTVSTATSDLATARVVGAVTISSATVDVDALSLGQGATLSLTDPAATVDLGKKIVGAGEIAIKGDDKVFSAANKDDDYTYLVGKVTFSNYGNTTFDGYTSAGAAKGQESGLSLFTTPWADDRITIDNRAGATWTDVGSTSDFQQQGGWGNSVFVNDGTFIENTKFGVTFDMAVVNNGVMKVGPAMTSDDHNAGILYFNGALSGSGTIEVGPENVLLADSVGGGQTLHFNAVLAGLHEPSLEIDNVPQFAGLISGFGENGQTDDQLVLRTLGSHLVGFVADGSGTGGALTFTDGSAVHLSGSYSPTGFHVSEVTGSLYTYTTVTYSA